MSLPEHLQGHLDLPERRAHLHPLHRALHLLKHLPRDLHALGERRLLALVLRLTHPGEHRLRHRDARYLIGEALGVARRKERPDPRHSRELESEERREGKRAGSAVSWAVGDATSW